MDTRETWIWDNIHKDTSSKHNLFHGWQTSSYMKRQTPNKMADTEYVNVSGYPWLVVTCFCNLVGKSEQGKIWCLYLYHYFKRKTCFPWYSPFNYAIHIIGSQVSKEWWVRCNLPFPGRQGWHLPPQPRSVAEPPSCRWGREMHDSSGERTHEVNSYYIIL